jgi:hypothetical protein
MSDMKIENKKRRTLKAVAVVSTGLVVTDVWKKPLINSVLLPAHAQTSASDTTPPVGGNATVAVNSNGVASGSLIARDNSGATPTVTIVSQPSLGNVSLSGLNFTYTASAGPGFTGSDSFTYKVTDASNNESPVYTVSISVNVPDDTTAPTGANATVSANSDGIATGSLIASDDTDTNPTVMIVSQASAGSVSLSGFDFTYTATTGSGFTGSDSFTYRVKDASNNESAVFTITVNSATPADNAPTGADGTFQANK